MQTSLSMEMNRLGCLSYRIGFQQDGDSNRTGHLWCWRAQVSARDSHYFPFVRDCRKSPGGT